MKQKKILIDVTAIFLLIIMVQCTPPEKYPKELDQLIPNTTLIFKAKIILLNTVTTDEEDVSNSGVVEISDIIEAPESFPNFKGEQITVRFSDISKVKVGEERMFFTDPYWIGESLGVNENGSVLKDDHLYQSKDIISHIKHARINQDDIRLRKLLKDAKLVIAGKVIRVQKPEGQFSIVTEHNPEWREAEIQVDETLKGIVEGKTIKILFASGKDVMFFQAPKLKEGDEGIFIISQTDDLTKKQMTNENTMTEPESFILGKDRAKHIKSLIE